MKAYVVVATKGRPREVGRLVSELARQTQRADEVVLVGAGESDVAGVAADALGPGRLTILLSDRPGASRQRNIGIEHLVAKARIGREPDSVVAFFDDDFRPAPDWLERACIAFGARPAALALGGRLLLNAWNTSEDTAAAIIAADDAERRIIPLPHVADGHGLYGCNMAIRGDVLVETRFDDGLPLYSWLEDADLSIRIKRLGEIAYAPACSGVHLNTAGARVSGVRFGYSQIANPAYLTRRGTMPVAETAKLIAVSFAANLFHSIRRRPGVDHPGRLRGNLKAAWDMVRNRDRPDRILQL